MVKVVRSDRETEPMLMRLRTERQILASLEHPNIARLYDGGNTEAGLPYFVMEYVEGVAIDAYCRQVGLSVDDRLTLFRKVCAAVQYAHQNLIVHRDIKPSNILVTADGEPKLLDFGIAKVLNPGLAASEIEPTAAWLRLLTPGYASPEQIRGKLITTVSDVYSLGVLLFKLLTGRLPYELADCSPFEIERRLTETDPPKPSALVATLPETPVDSESGQPNPPELQETETDMHSLARTLQGDIDAIVLKALRSKPSRRYDSVERFAADIANVQLGLPVAARAPSWRYRAGKFVRRNRRATGALATIVALVIGFVIALLLQAERIAVERDLAMRESVKKSRVMALMLDIFELSSPYVMPETELTVRDALEHSLPILADGLREHPEIRAELLHTTGSIFGVLGAFTRAEEQLTEAFEIRQDLYGHRDPKVAESMSALAGVRKELDDDLSEAERLARQALEVLRNHLGPGHPDLTDPLVELVSILCYQENYTSAAPLAAEALSLADDDRRITALGFLAHIHSRRGEYLEASDLNRQALDLYRRIYGEKYPGQILILSNLGFQLRRLGKLQEAQETYETALALHHETFGENYPELILINNLAGVRFAMGDYATAEQGYREALGIVLDRYGSEHWRVLALGLRIARTLTHQGEAAEAEQQIRRLLDRRLVDDDHPLNAEGRSILGESLSVQARCEAAETVLVESLEIFLAQIGNDRMRRDAFERLRDHFERCGNPEAILPYETRLLADQGQVAKASVSVVAAAATPKGLR